jgi:hypothetical protein
MSLSLGPLVTQTVGTLCRTNRPNVGSLAIDGNGDLTADGSGCGIPGKLTHKGQTYMARIRRSRVLWSCATILTAGMALSVAAVPAVGSPHRMGIASRKILGRVPASIRFSQFAASLSKTSMASYAGEVAEPAGRVTVYLASPGRALAERELASAAREFHATYRIRDVRYSLRTLNRAAKSLSEVAPALAKRGASLSSLGPDIRTNSVKVCYFDTAPTALAW